MTDRYDSDWREWPSVNLIVLLTNAGRVSYELYNDAVRGLLINLKCSSDYDSIAECVLLCLLERNLKSTTEEDIFKEIKTILHSEAGQQNHKVLWGLTWIVQEVYKVHPQMVMHHLATITRLLLVSDNRYVEKDTRDWLRNGIFVQAPLVKPYALDEIRLLSHKVYAMKELLADLGAVLNHAIHRSDSCSSYEYVIDAYHDCSNYLYLVSSSLNSEREEWLQSEAPDTEDNTELDTAVQELFDESSYIEGILNNHERLRDQIREWQEEYSVSDAPANSNVVEIEDGES